MNPYEKHEQTIREHVRTICNQVAVPGHEPQKAVYKMTGHPAWKQLLESALATNEIEGIDFYRSYKAEDAIVLMPSFIKGFPETYFTGNVEKVRERVAHITFKHRSHWTRAHFNEVNKIFLASEDMLKDCLELFEDMLKDKDKVILVSGPISTGGYGDRTQNLKVFHDAIVDLSLGEKMVLNTLPIQHIFAEFARKKHAEGWSSEKIGDTILEEYYFVLMEKYVDLVSQLPRWKSSYGAVKEHRKAVELAIKCKLYKPSKKIHNVVYLLS